MRGFFDGREVCALNVFGEADGVGGQVVEGADVGVDCGPSEKGGGGEAVKPGDEVIADGGFADCDGIEHATLRDVVGEVLDGVGVDVETTGGCLVRVDGANGDFSKVRFAVRLRGEA